jgi:hypothetical protein
MTEAPWKRSAPNGTRHTTFSDKDKAEAKARAHAKGRHYPNFVDNMAMARKKRS